MSGTWYHTWSKRRVKEPSLIPEKPHYALLAFSDHKYTTPGYDRDDPDDHHTVKVCDYYAFESKEEWEKMITSIYTERHSKKQWSQDEDEIVFYRCDGRGSVKVSIDVKVGD